MKKKELNLVNFSKMIYYLSAKLDWEN